MTSAKGKQKEKEETEEIPATIPDQRAQMVPVGTMDVDSATGGEIRVGVPESSDEDAVAALLLWLQEEADDNNADAMKILADQIRLADNASSLAEALREKPTVNGKDFIDQPFMAHGFTINEGKFEGEDIPYFASIEATNAAHPKGFVVNCGGGKVLVHLRTLQRYKAFPLPLKITGKTTRKGHVVLSFEVLQHHQR